MIDTLTVRAAWPLRRILVTLVVILATTASLLLAQSLERMHPADLTRTAPVAPISEVAAVEVDRATLAQATNALRDSAAPFACLRFACSCVLLLALIRLHRTAAGTLFLSPRVHWSHRSGRPEAPPRPVTLISLCISRT